MRCWFSDNEISSEEEFSARDDFYSEHFTLIKSDVLILFVLPTHPQQDDEEEENDEEGLAQSEKFLKFKKSTWSLSGDFHFTKAFKTPPHVFL